MIYRTKIKIFEIIDNINLPLAENPNEIAQCGIGSHLICYDGKNVYAHDWSDNKEGDFVLLLPNLDFIEMNKSFFDILI